jgi:ribokinase
MDMVVRTERLPRPGETLAGRSFANLPGGKGANQAAAAARLGASTALIGCVGDDVYGPALVAGLEADGVDCRAVEACPGVMTGVALVTVEDGGQNAIVIVAGANAALTPEMVARHAGLIDAADFVLLQLEVPPETVAWAIGRARAAGARVVLNPAPAKGPLPRAWLEAVDWLVPNELEAAELAGLPMVGPQGARRAAEALRAAGARGVVVTLGAEGVFAHVDGAGRRYPARRVEAVDTTAAGDTFVGGFAAGLAAGRRVAEAIAFGQAAASISVTRTGARASIPRAEEVAAMLEQGRETC